MKYMLYKNGDFQPLLDRIKLADNFIKRLKGFLGKVDLDFGQGLVIKPCNHIQTFGMRSPIDVAFIDEENNVIYLIKELRKSKVSPIVKGSMFVIETRAGEFHRLNLELGERSY